MSTWRLGARTPDGLKQIFEVDDLNSWAMARDFVIRETKAAVCLALVNPVEKPEFIEPEKLMA